MVKGTYIDMLLQEAVINHTLGGLDFGVFEKAATWLMEPIRSC